MAEEQQQGNVRQEFNLGRVGLNMDLTVNQIEKGKLTYALNANLENFDASSVNYQNEQGNNFCLDFPDGYQLIGEHFIQEKNKHIFFLANTLTGGSEIGYMDNNDCVYHTWINGFCLNFKVEHPIHKAVHKISNCTTEVYWTDGFNPRRFIDLENPPFATIFTSDTICDQEILPLLDCNKIKVQPNFSIPELTINSIANGGDLIAGTYQFAIQYSSALGDAYTSYYSITNPTPISNTQLTTANFDYAVGKSIIVDISNIDVTGYFEYYNIAVIKTINGASTVNLVGTYFIDGISNQITYSGQYKTEISLSTADIFEKYPYYEIAEDLTTVQDVLVWDNLTSVDRTNYQKIANQIDLFWETYRMPAGETYADSLNATNLRGYLRDEVYAFEIVFILKNGKQTDGFHIPGRVSTLNDLVTINKADNADYIGTGTSAPYWKIYNTASVIGDALGPNIGNATPYKYGQFSYWESIEEYPCNTNVWGNLAGQPIRHHKFPDVLVSPIFENPEIVYDGNKIIPTMQKANAIYPIGVKVDTQQIISLINISDLTDEQKSEIAAYKIVRGNRSTNQSIVAKGIIRNVGQYTRDDPYSQNPTYYFYPNYPYNDLNEDPFLLQQNNAYNSQCQTYRVNVTITGTMQITDCYTNEPVTIDMTTPINSLTVPLVISGAATFTNITLYSYTLTVYPGSGDYTAFSYQNDLSESVIVNVVAGTPVTIDSVTVPVRTGGSEKYSILSTTNNKNTSAYPDNLNGLVDGSKSRMVFNSPETSFGQPILGNVLKLESAFYGAGRAHFVKVKNHAGYKLISKQAQIDALNSSYNIANLTGTLDATAMFTAFQAYLQIYLNGISRQNFAYSFNSIAQYDYNADILNEQVGIYGVVGVKQRELDIAQYLIPGVQSVGDVHNVKNFQRESSVYLRTSVDAISMPFAEETPSLVVAGQSIITDNSRFTISGRDNCAAPETQEDISVVSYYGSIKNVVPNQWGQMYSYTTIDTGYQVSLTNPLASQPDVAFGGDTFIGRFSFKTKLPFFIDNRVGAPDDSDIFYDEIGNIAYPQYWYSARSVLSNYQAGSGANAQILKNIISVKAHYLDCPNDNTYLSNTTTTTSSTTNQNPAGSTTLSPTTYAYNGKMYLFAYGIPYYYVESSINVDLRQAFNNLEGDFYPHVSSGIPDNWLQQTFVPIAFDNTYTYNVTYSRQNTENNFSHLPVDWKPDLCYTNYPFRAIYSEQQSSNPSTRVNSWLSYTPVSFFDFPQNFGKLVALDGIQNKAVLARFENKSLLYNTMLTINTSNPQAAYLGNSTLFKSAPPIDFAETDLGYVGSQNKMLLKIPQGQITLDAKRGQIFLISANQATDMSAFGSGVNRFITDHLAFEILKYYPNADTDNHFNGIGIHGVYDSKYDRVIISKLDYIPQPDYIDVIKYDPLISKYYIENIIGTEPLETVTITYVDLTDIKYFCNKSWTLSFNMNTKSWVSFHSYIPNFYIAENNFFYSGLNGGCDLEAVAIHEIPEPTTTTTTTTAALNCNLNGTALYVFTPCDYDGTAVYIEPCIMEGTAQYISTTTTTTTLNCNLEGTAVTIHYVVQRCVEGEPSGLTYTMFADDITPPSVGTYYKLFCVDIPNMDGVNCWLVLSITTDAEDGNGTFGTGYGDCGCDTAPTTTTTTTTCNPTPNWVNNGANFCSDCVSFEPQIDINPCSPTYNTTRNLNLGAGAPCDYNQNWVNEGGVFCSDCTTYQTQRQLNPCAADYNTTRNVNLGPGSPCNYSPNWVNTGTTCVVYDLYNVQTDTNPCSPTYGSTQLGSLIEANSPSCGYVPPTYYYYELQSCTTSETSPAYSIYDSLSGVFVLGPADCYSILSQGGSGTTPLGANLDVLANPASCLDSLCTTTTTTTTIAPAYECPSSGGTCYATLAECNDSGCPDCAASVCIP
jgi:hypothetical protein